MQRLVAFAPATGGLALWAKHADLDDAPAPDAPPLVTDGDTLFYAPAFEALPLDEQAGHVAHATMHVALRHADRFRALDVVAGCADAELFAVCADAIVNSSLAGAGWLKLPAGAVFLEDLLPMIEAAKHARRGIGDWDVERLYHAIDDRPAFARKGRAGRGGTGGSGTADETDAHAEAGGNDDGPRSAKARALARRTACDLRPGDGDGDPPEVREANARLWSARLAAAHAEDGAFSMLRGLLADLPKSRVPWEWILRTKLARYLVPSSAPSWSRATRSYIARQGRAGPDRRLPWEPGRSSTRPVPSLAVIVDISGSIDDALVRRFASEVASIAKRTGARLALVVGDDRVRHVEVFAPGEASLESLAVEGGGGTDFAPLLAEAAKHGPDVAVVLTDLEGPAGARPRFPVVWAIPVAALAPSTPGFGSLVVVD